MQVLSFGYKLPETGDFGDVWFVAIEDNITRLNAHTHDGTNSSKITSSSISAVTQTVVSGSFGLVGTKFEATVTAVGITNIDEYAIHVKDPTTKDPIYLEVEKVSTTQYKLFTNTVQDFEVYYLS